MEFENNAYFWQKIDTLYLSSDITISQPKGSRHHVYSNLIYPLDYGYLNEQATDAKLPIYVGTNRFAGVQAIIVCADILKKDMDVKLIADTTEQEETMILEFLNQTDFQKSVIMRRGHNIPAWANKE